MESNTAMPGMAYSEIAASAYRAYANSTGNKNYQGLPMPAFHELSIAIQTAWEAAIRQTERCYYHPEGAAACEETWKGWVAPHLRGNDPR